MFFYMGAYTLNPSDIGNEKIIIPFPTDAIQIAYWNRYTLLHGFFMDLYHRLGGLQQFNYISILANHEDLGVVCGRGRNPTLRLWPTIFSGKIDVFPGDRRSRLISSMTSVAPA